MDGRRGRRCPLCGGRAELMVLREEYADGTVKWVWYAQCRRCKRRCYLYEETVTVHRVNGFLAVVAVRRPIAMARW